MIENRCKQIIHANNYRIDYLYKIGVINNLGKHQIVRNYADYNKSSIIHKDKNVSVFKSWLNGEQYVYIQGVNSEARYPYQTLKSILMINNLKCVVVGEMHKKSFEKLTNEFGNKIHQLFFFTGQIPQETISAYLKDALFTIILYHDKTPNNYYCEPNRFFHSLVFNIPVIVGYNPPMKDLVEQHDFGIVLPSDGRDITEIYSAISEIIKNHSIYEKNIIKYNKHYFWSDAIVNKILYTTYWD